jgi:GGDEF domain-containing protein/CHASE3 domain sensor protein
MKAPKLTIKQKLLLSYLGMALLTAVASAYAVISLQNLNQLAHVITNQDYAILEISKSMMDALLAQENTEKKFLIFKDPSFTSIFWTRSRDFKQGIEKAKEYHVALLTKTLSQLADLQGQYDALFQKELALIQENRMEEASLLSDQEGKIIIEAMATHVRTMGKQAEEDIDRHMGSLKDQGLKASRITIALSLISLIAGFTLALLITYNIARPLKKLEKATALIAEGTFNNDLNMNRQDAIGSLARAFIVMAERLKTLESFHRDASPLTGLPGNLAIEKHIKKRLAEKHLFSLCHVDLDNFKPFTDHYGYAWGSEIIKEVGNILTNQVKTLDVKDVFIGHVGGDDFIIIAEPHIAETMCQCILTEFDQCSLKFYSPEDRLKGFFVGKDRGGIKRHFPLITMTIAIVTDDGSRFHNPLDMAELAAKLKEYAKTLPGSNYVKIEDVPHMFGRQEKAAPAA